MIHFNTNKIIIPIDFSETSLLAVRHGAFLAQYTKGEVFLLHVISRQWEKYNAFEPSITLENLDQASENVQRKLEEVATDIRKNYGIQVTCVVNSGNPTKEIVNLAEEIKAGLVVMGTHGYSAWEDLVIGSNALKVITKCPCPVIAMNSHSDKLGYNRVLLPIDTSGHTRQKVVPTIELAKHFSAHVYALGLLTSSEANEKNGMQVILSQIEKSVKEAGLNCTIELMENVKNRAYETVKYSKQINADLISIMTDQEAEVTGLFLGPYALQVIHHSKVPVVSFKPEEYSGTDVSMFSGTSGF